MSAVKLFYYRYWTITYSRNL